jgi:hypothetical protein
MGVCENCQNTFKKLVDNSSTRDTKTGIDILSLDRVLASLSTGRLQLPGAIASLIQQSVSTTTREKTFLDNEPAIKGKGKRTSAGDDNNQKKKTRIRYSDEQRKILQDHRNLGEDGMEDRPSLIKQWAKGWNLPVESIKVSLCRAYSSSNIMLKDMVQQ